jgi:hypothetical protein
MGETEYVTRGELAEIVQQLRSDVHYEMRQAVEPLEGRMDRFERWLAVNSTATLIILLVEILILRKVGL